MIFRIVLALAIVAIADTVNPLVERVGDTGFIQLEADSFNTLDARHQALAYWLTQAAIAIDPIIYDQMSQFGIREKRLLEEIVGNPQGIPADVSAKLRQYALLFWANRGNHNENTSQKFLPDFTFEELTQAASSAQKNGAFKTAYADLPPLATEDALSKELGELKQSMFDPNFEPMNTAKNAVAG